MKAKAYARSLDADEDDRIPLEHYLDVVDYKKIIENKQNWPRFQNVFDIPDPGEKGYAKNVKWMDRVNELRRISAHPSRERHYKLEDFEYIDYIYTRLNENLRAVRDSVTADRANGNRIRS